jgi:hypothetical protein
MPYNYPRLEKNIQTDVTITCAQPVMTGSLSGAAMKTFLILLNAMHYWKGKPKSW